MVSSLSDAQKAARGTLDAVLLSEPICSLEISEVEHGVGPRQDVHGLVGGDARLCCRTTGGERHGATVRGVLFPPVPPEVFSDASEATSTVCLDSTRGRRNMSG